MTQAEFDFLRESLLLKCDNLLRKIVEKMTENEQKEIEKGDEN